MSDDKTVVEDEPKVDENGNPVEDTQDPPQDPPVDDDPDDTPKDDNPKGDDDIEKVVEERLAKMKSNMDRMAKERDEALRKANEMEKAKRDAEMERLREEGKVQEALEMEMAEIKAKYESLESENTQLKRDRVIHDNLAGLDFRNERSREMAYRDIMDQLVQNDKGEWVHKSGTSIKEFVDAYSKDEDNSFLFRVKSNSGTGSPATGDAPSTGKEKSVTEMTSQELLEAARKGKIGRYQI